MKKSWWLQAAGIVLLALLLRLPLLGGSFWLDEAAQALESVRPLAQQLQIREDFQPPLLHLITHFALQVGQSEWWLRLVGAVIPGLASILGTMLIARLLLPKKFQITGSLLVGIFLATNSFHLFFSQELRPYALPMAFAVWSWWSILADKRQPGRRLVWLLCSIFGLYSSYLYPFVLVTQLLALVLLEKKHFVRTWLWPSILSISVFLPWLPSFWEQLQTGQLLRLQLPGWQAAVSTGQLKTIPLVIVKFLFGIVDVEPNLWYVGSCLVVAALVASLIFAIRKQVFQKKFWQTNARFGIILLWLVVPITVAWLVSFFVPVIQPKRVLFLLPAWYLAIVWLYTLVQTRGRAVRVLGCALLSTVLLLNFAGTAQYFLNPKLQREDWRGALDRISQTNPDAFTLSNFSGPFAPIAWYHRHQPNARDLATRSIPITSDKQAASIIGEIKQDYQPQTIIYFEYLTDLTDPQHYLRDSLEHSGYRLQDLLDYPGIGFVRTYQYQPSYAARL
ncbi:hypothetical protein KC921_04485 [Candidatus Woesebacteria bacterium]|nr:hypothetical protein [Candidatus Woesebacteria bacterium]